MHRKEKAEKGAAAEEAGEAEEAEEKSKTFGCLSTWRRCGRSWGARGGEGMQLEV